MSSKTFKDLIKEVHEKGICQECGGCVSFCSSAEYDVIALKDSFSPPVYVNEDKCLECGICYYICPQTNVLDNELNKTYKFKDYSSMPIGNYKEVLSCQATDEEFLKYGTDGGVVNSIINYLLEKKLIDGAIVSRTDAPFSREATFADSKYDLIKASGAKLDMSPHLDEIQKFCTYTHSIQKLNHYKFKKLAVVGTPCQIYTVRCMQDLGVTPSQNIEICLGLFCYENFLFDKSQVEKFERDFNVSFENIEKINIKQDLIFRLKDEGTGEKLVHIPFNQIEKYMRPACRACNDFTNIFADISFGGLSSPDKYTTVITRTKKGEELFSKALNAGIIRALNIDKAKRTEMINLISQFSQSKIERKDTFMEKLK
ncbi:MAG: Coenzyme F420 hydrogenase/dehydrogenase, beta subunit C-terminal domain [Promethearchaeota archaeon]|jgi:coenzyme F420 hydrogenase subunit beta